MAGTGTAAALAQGMGGATGNGGDMTLPPELLSLKEKERARKDRLRLLQVTGGVLAAGNVGAARARAAGMYVCRQERLPACVPTK